MAFQTVTLRLPEDIYWRLQRAAQTIQRSLEDVMFQTIRGNLPPTMDDLPADLQDKLVVLSTLNDDALWKIAREPLPPDQWRRHQRLLHKNEDSTLTSAEGEELARLRAVTDRFVLRRSYALALLKWRGHTLPVPE